MALEPLPSLYKIFNMVQQEENHKRVIFRRDQRYAAAAAFAVTHAMKSSRDQQGERPKRPVCSHYAKVGHKEVACYELIGTRLAGTPEVEEVAEVGAVRTRRWTHQSWQRPKCCMRPRGFLCSISLGGASPSCKFSIRRKRQSVGHAWFYGESGKMAPESNWGSKARTRKIIE